MFDHKYDAYLEVRKQEFELLRLDLSERRKQWELQMRAILARGQMEWTDGEKKLKAKYEAWVESSSKAYQEKTQAWGDKYLSFLQDKKAWVASVTAQSTMIGDQTVLEEFGNATQSAIDAAGADIQITDMELPEDADSLLSESLDLELLDQLLENAQSLNESIGMFKPVIFSALDPDQYTSADLLQKIKDSQCEEDEELKKRMAQLKYEQMMDQVRAAEEQLAKQVKSANEGMDRSMNETFTDSGYSRSGGKFEKDLVVGASVAGGLSYRHVSVDAFSYFNYDLDLGRSVAISDLELATLDSGAIDERLDTALGLIEDRTEEIFGDEDDLATFALGGLATAGTGASSIETKIVDGKTLYRNKDGEFVERDQIGDEFWDDSKITQRFMQEIEKIETLQEAYEAKEPVEVDDEHGGSHLEERVVTKYREVTRVTRDARGVDLSPGEFGEHVGYAPEFSDEVDLDAGDWKAEGNIKFEGSGELGRIMGEFIYNSMREGKGYAEANLPGYSQPLWDDNDSWLEAPSYRSVVDMGITIACLVVPGAQPLAPIIGMIDDAAFTAADVSAGQMSWQEGLLSMGKQAALAAVGFIPGAKEGMTLFESAMANVGKQFMTNTLSGMVNSLEFNYDADGGITGMGMNGDIIRESVVGTGALAGYASGFASEMVTGSISKAMSGMTAGYYGKVANLAGDLAGEAARYAVWTGAGLMDGEWEGWGGEFQSSFDAMGGLTVNIANLGAMMDFAQIMGLSTDGWDTQRVDEMNQLIGRLSGTGIFELNFSSSGTTGRFGMGGMDLGGSLYGIGKGAAAKALITNYTDQSVGNMMDLNYGLGDDMAEDTVWRILFGKDKVAFDRNGENNEQAETIADGDGNRTIHMDFDLAGASGTSDLALLAATVFQHESWRDGVDSGNNQGWETYNAVLSHTQIAMALGDEFGEEFIAGNQNLSNDVANYEYARDHGDMGLFADYVGAAYEGQSGDFWKVTKDGRLVRDGDGWLKDEDGNYIGKDGKKYTKAEFDALSPEQKKDIVGAADETEGLRKILGLPAYNGVGKAIATDLMKRVAKLGDALAIGDIVNALRDDPRLYGVKRDASGNEYKYPKSLLSG